MSSTLLIGRPSDETRALTDALMAAGCPCERVDGDAAALRRLRHQPFEVVITDPETTIDEDLALLDEVLAVRPDVKPILLAPVATPVEVIAALRARVYVCLTAPYDAAQIAELVSRSKNDDDWRIHIEVLSARPEWVALRASCRTLTAERIVSFLDELHSQVPEALRHDMMQGFRQVLLTSMEISRTANDFKVVDVSAVRTDRTLVFYVRDAMSVFQIRSFAYATAAGSTPPPYPVQLGTKLAQYATLLADGVVDECISSELGNEVLLIKHTA
jgi:ActR/RegA family two-component response regulator